MDRDVDLAMHHAVDLARARGGPLASVTLRGAGLAATVETLARAALRRLGVECHEVRFEAAAGPVRLVSVEIQR